MDLKYQNLPSDKNVVRLGNFFKKDLFDCKMKVLKESSSLKEKENREVFLNPDGVKLELANKRLELVTSLRNIRKLKESSEINKAKISDRINTLSLSCLTVYNE